MRTNTTCPIAVNQNLRVEQQFQFRTNNLCIEMHDVQDGKLLHGKKKGWRLRAARAGCSAMVGGVDRGKICRFHQPISTSVTAYRTHRRGALCNAALLSAT